MEEIKIQVSFTEDTKHGLFADALYFTEDEWANIKQEEIDALKQARIDTWIQLRQHPLQPTEPTKEQLQEALNAAEEQEKRIVTEKSEYQAKLAMR